jgi:hypothetical protein
VSLLAQAAADSRAILEDAAGFATPMTFTAPTGDTLELKGTFFDIGYAIDAETGQAVAGNTVQVLVSAGRFQEAGFELPRGTADASSKPWRVELTDSLGRARSFKVANTAPDRTLNVLQLTLEAYKI